MTRGGQGRWRHLFVQQRAFGLARAAGVRSFADLVERPLETDPVGKGTLTLVSKYDSRVATERFKKLLPVYSLEAAAGYFGEGKAVELEGWVEVTGRKKLTEDMFVARIVGHSMEPEVHDGDYVILRANPAGTRNGRIVLASGPITDPELGGSFTVKVYSSKKVVDPDGGWRHSEVVLLPVNLEYKQIRLREREAAGFRIVAEYVDKLPDEHAPARRLIPE